MVQSAAGPATIANAGFKWLQLVPDHHKWWLTVMYDVAGELIQYYFDVIHSAYISDTGELRFRDMFLDIVMSADGSWKLLDMDELKSALDNGRIYQDEFARAISVSKELSAEITDNEPAWRDICSKAIKELN
jgi:predicted RNA-binding protein associated with RNAse of E/G family